MQEDRQQVHLLQAAPQHHQQNQQRTMSASKPQYIMQSVNMREHHQHLMTVNQSSQSSKIKLSHLEQASSAMKDPPPAGSKKTSTKQNKSFETTSRNQLPPNQNNAKLNATLMAIMSGTKGGKSSTKQASSKHGGVNASFSKKPVVSRAKSACKGKAELFNSTAPLKFFTNLEETTTNVVVNTRERAHDNNTYSTKMSSSKGARQATTSNPRGQGSTNYGGSGADERAMIQGGTQQISVPKIHPPTQRPSASSKRRPGNETSSKQQIAAAKNLASYQSVGIAGANSSELVAMQFNNTGIITDLGAAAAVNMSNENNNFVNNSITASFQGDYIGNRQSQKGTKNGRQQGHLPKSSLKLASNQVNNSQHNSKIKLRLNQQKTRSSSSISNAKNNFNNTQRPISGENEFGIGHPMGHHHDNDSGGKGVIPQNNTSKMSQALSQKGVAKMAAIRMTQTKIRQQQQQQNTSSTVSNGGLLQSETMNHSMVKVPLERDQKVSKSFLGATTAASKKQRQTLKGMIEGFGGGSNTATTTTNGSNNQNATATQPSSIPGSSSKRKTSHSQYMSNSMTIKGKRGGGANGQHQSQANNTGNYGQQDTSLTLSKTKEKIYQSYNYQSVGGKSSATSNTQQHKNHQNAQSRANSGQPGGSKSSSSHSQLPKSKKNLNNSLLKVPMGSSATGNGNMLPQFARVDFDRLNNRKERKNVNDEKSVPKGINDTNFMESYQDISGNNLLDQNKKGHSSTKGLSKSTQKAFLSASNRFNQPKHSVHKSIEDSSSYFATCTASGPLNPFLEQILREIPNAYSGNASGLNSAGATCALDLNGIGASKEMTAKLNMHGLTSSKASVNQKKAMGKISKKIRSNMKISDSQKTQVSTNFNLTTTAAALLAASDKNAPAFSNTEMISQTFESKNTNSVNDSVFKIEERSGAQNSSKKQSLSKSFEGSKSLAADKRLTLHKRVSESRGHIRVNSQVRLSKNSFSQSQKRKKESSQKPSEVMVYINDCSSKPDAQGTGTSSQKRQQSHTKLPGQQATATESAKIGSLINVVKVAAKQKEGKLNATALNQKLNLRQKQNHNSLNTTTALEGQLMKIKLGSTNQIPQRSKVQSKSRGALNTSTGNIQTSKIPSKKRSPVQKLELQNQAKETTATTEQTKLTIPSKKQIETKITSKQRGKTNDQQNRRSNLKFDWSGFLSNLMHENFKPKNSTSGPGNAAGPALCEKPYELQQDMQNKTQPLPKNLIQKDTNQHDAYDLQNRGAVKRTNAITYGGMNLPKTESRGSDYRPRIGRKQIEIAPIGGAQNNFAATMNNMQLKNAKEADIPVMTVLTEVTGSGEVQGRESPSSCPSSHRTPEIVNQDYKFGRQLGEGAYAVVRLAYKKSEGKNYAAKIYDKSKLVDEHRRNSVCREVMLMQKLKHPFVVQFLEAFETDQHVFLIMEYVAGKSLHDYLKKQRASPTNKTEFDQTLAEDEVKRIIKQLLQCLEYLHNEGITHRDIKLENILLDSNGNIKIIDFGFSTSYKPQKKLKMFCGTPSYMAPEIVSRVEYYGPPADIWASAVLLFCLLNGFFPFKGQTDAELYRKINRGAFKLIRSDLSDDCLNVLKEMFTINPDSRITASELLQENWFLSDSSKKRSIAEIRREFKAKMLKKFPVRSMNKNTICIPAPQLDNFTANTNQSNQGHETEESKAQQMTEINQKNADLIAQNSLALYRNVNQASPPSMVPDSQVTQNDQVSQSFENGMQLELGSSEGNDEQINQEAFLAYYNTSGVQGVHPQASAPPSGKFNLNPYSAYNDWNAQGSPPSVADVGVEITSTSGNENSMNQRAPLAGSEYHPLHYLAAGEKHPMDEIVSAADIEIIIAGKPGKIVDKDNKIDFSEYRGHEQQHNNQNEGLNNHQKGGGTASNNVLIYGMEGNSTPANKQ